jgi:hypothetical protein
MIYAAVSFWLSIVVLLAWGVHHLWSTIAKPRTINAILLPGTLMTQLGHVVGLLITGGTVNNTALMRDDDDGGPATDPSPQPKLPVIGPVIVALLPMMVLGLMIYLVIMKLGMDVVMRMPQERMVAPTLPGTMAAFWDQLRSLVTLSENTLDAVWASGFHWRIVVFVYLMICLTVRMAPLPGNVRGHLGAIVTLGIVAWLVSTMSPAKTSELIADLWPLLTLTIGWLLVLMLISLVARGAVTAVQMIIRAE